MNVVGNRTNRKDNNKYQTTNIIYDQNTMSIIKYNKMTLASDKTQTKQINLCFIRKNMGPVLNGAGKQVDKKEKRAAKFKNTFLFLKTINFTVIIVIGSTEIPKRFVYISIGTI